MAYVRCGDGHAQGALKGVSPQPQAVLPQPVFDVDANSDAGDAVELFGAKAIGYARLDGEEVGGDGFDFYVCWFWHGFSQVIWDGTGAVPYGDLGWHRGPFPTVIWDGTGAVPYGDIFYLFCRGDPLWSPVVSSVLLSARRKQSFSRSCADGYAQCPVEHGIGCDVADEYALFDQAGEDSIWIGDFKEDEVGV